MAIKYCDSDSVEAKVKGKVRITDDPENETDLMDRALLTQLIEEAEADVEHDLSPRYLAPFQGPSAAAFSSLPDMTRVYLKTMCELKAVIRVLETDFGTGTAMSGDKYKKGVEDRYTAMLEKQTELRSNSFNMFKFPPLPSLTLNYHNHAADDGYAGEVLSTTQGDGGFPAFQINDPSETFANGSIDGDSQE